MTNGQLHKTLTYSIATIWLANGLFCKLLNFVPRHQQIVARILGNEYAHQFTMLIGLFETAMAIWTISRLKSRLNVTSQIVIIGTMNVLEFFLAPHLLLWGRFNLIFALVLMMIIYYNEFYLNKTSRD